MAVSPAPAVELDRVLVERAVEPLYQPVVDLDREVAVGYEALARGTDGSSPAELFTAARQAGRVVELDWLCRERAVEGARAAGLRHPLSLLVNAEPETLLASDDETALWGRFGDLRCYAELTERRLADAPAELLRAVALVREQDWGIALDDVGADPASLGLLPLVRPDIIKLDLRVVQDGPQSNGDVRVARVLHAALAQAADTGAVVVAEGVETPWHLDLARAYGAHYGQGYLLGRPAPLPSPLVSPGAAIPLLQAGPAAAAVTPSPFAVVASAAPTRRLGRDAAFEAVRQLLAQACELDPAPAVLLCVGRPGPLPTHLLELLGRLSAAPVLGLLGNVPHGRPLADDDPARDDLDVVVVSAHFAGALVGRPALGAGAADQLDGVLTFDRPLVLAAATALLHRMRPAG